MMSYLFDTNILIHQARNSIIWDFIKDKYFPKGVIGNARTSIVSVAEADVFAIGNKWGKQKIDTLKQNSIDLNPIYFRDNTDIIKNYTSINLFSQNKYPNLNLPKNLSPRNMGKNDIWIAATAATFNFPLITTDKDFSHLDDVFLEVIYIDMEAIFNNQ